MKRTNLLYLATLIFYSCSHTPSAWEIDAGMSKDKVIAVLENNNLQYEDGSCEINVEGALQYFNQNWDSMSITFNNNDEVCEVGFYNQSNSINCYSLCESISKQVGDDKGCMGTFTTWGKDDVWLISFANNEAPFPQALVYRYLSYYDDKKNVENLGSSEDFEDETEE